MPGDRGADKGLLERAGLQPPDPRMWKLAKQERRRFRRYVRSIRTAHPGWLRFHR